MSEEAIIKESSAQVTNSTDDPQQITSEAVSWQASEFMYHEKPTSWFVVLLAIAAVLCLPFALFGWWLSVALIVVIAVAIMVYTKRQPRVLQYKIDNGGLSIDERKMPYSQFKAYSLSKDLSWFILDLEPAKRFSPRLSILVNPETIEAVDIALAAHLPIQQHKLDRIEELFRKLKF